jgi:hypothetical protein
MKGFGVVFALVLISGLLALPSCDGGGSSNDTQQTQLPVCAAHTFRMMGTIDNMSIDINEANGGGFDQDDTGGEFLVGTSLDSSLTMMKLDWTQLLPDGGSEAATGTFTLGSGALAGQAFCAGAGSLVHIPSDPTQATIQFQVTGLASGDGCTTAHTGTLQGCLN